MKLEYDKSLTSLVPTWLQNSKTYMMAIIDFSGKYMFVNECFKQKYKFICEDFLSQTVHNTVFHEDLHKCGQAVEKILMDSEAVVCLQMRKPDRSLENFYWTTWEFSAFKDDSGQLMGIFCIGHDISDSENAAINAQKFQNRFDLMVNNMSEGYMLLSAEGKLLCVNQVMQDLLAIPLEIDQIYTLKDLLSEDMFLFDRNIKYEVLITLDNSVEFVAKSKLTDQWIDFNIFYSKEGWSFFAKNITDQMLEKMRNEENLSIIEKIYESSHTVLVYFDANLSVRFYSKSAELFFQKNFQVKLCKGLHLLSLFKQQVHLTILQSMQDLSKELYDWKTLPVIAGKWLPDVFAVRDSQKVVIGCVLRFQDVSQYRKEQIEKMAYFVTHDIRGSLANIPSLLSMLKAEEMSEGTAEILELLTYGVEKSLQAVNQFMTYSKQTTDTLNAEWTSFDLTTEINTLLDKLRFIFENKAQQLNTEIPASVLVNADKKQIVTLLENLLSNASKYTPHQGRIDFSVSINQAKGVEIRVKDTGLGMSAQDIENAFTQFGKLTAQPTNGETSTGLGLWICKQIVDQHKGKIQIASEGLHKGTTFRLVLPILTQQERSEN